ncbi:Two component transcriptional regulator, AraC familyYesN5 [Thermobacillus xylanilyticus]|uniref:Two component transcriptional regulator, AraC familyYesN5 n=2 Tax=Thermobacillus xylanilyticus TaxID=76633 RepID=A0ABM8V467_THEXY|nr:Two component transcriptional regulator, AraC familyYesN5 [Thermobacillus xylanilyticus]
MEGRNDMRTLLIVDDERNIRLGLKAMIDRECADRYETLTAESGREALDIIRSRKTDILITDIRMPEMDGFALIREAAEAGHRPAVIILSGYDDFAYAREAIQYGVKEYLLKPIVREELYRALDRVEEALRRAEQTEELRQQAERYRTDMAASVFAYLLVGDSADEAVVMQRAEAAGLTELLTPDYAVGVLKTAGDPLGRAKAEDWLKQRAAEGMRAIWTVDRDGLLVFASPDPGLAEMLAGELARICEPPVYVGLSEREDSAARLPERYRQAKRALKRSLVMPPVRSAVLTASPACGAFAADVPMDEVRKLANMLGTGRDQEMAALAGRLFELPESPDGGVAYIEALSRALNEQVFDQVFRTFGEESVEVLKLHRRVGSLDHYASLADYRRDVEELLLLLSDYIRSLRSAHAEHKEMRAAVAYIRENYWKDLNMAMAANHVSLNYAYFGQLFKEYTGESFVSYLRRVRIEKAKELLVHTDAKVYEIAERVGFDNVKHFNRVFKEHEGITALEYRQRHAVFAPDAAGEGSAGRM